jgi:hypothetical protein
MTTEQSLLDVDAAPAAPHRFGLILTAVAVTSILLGALAGFFASALHPGPRGHTGVTGAAGTTGTAGAAGKQGLRGVSGSAASVADLGICYDAPTDTSTAGNFFVTSIYITSVSKHADGTTYCATGTYVPVSPAPVNNSPTN